MCSRLLIGRMMMMKNCFCGMVDRRKACRVFPNRDHCQRSSTLQISDMPRAGFEPAQNLSSESQSSYLNRLSIGDLIFHF